MQLDHESILSYRVMSQADFWLGYGDMDGDLLWGFACDRFGYPHEDRVIIVDRDPYADLDDLWLDYDGRKFLIDLDIYTVRDVMDDKKLSLDEYPISIAYYIEFDACLPDKAHPFAKEYIRKKKIIGER